MNRKDADVVAVAGDWHGNTRWAVQAVHDMAALLPDAGKIILHLGDFGIWPGTAGQDYLQAVDGALLQAGAELWFTPGNHDDYDQIDSWQGEQVAGTQRIRCLPRGHRWTWHGRTWLSVGGAVSVDKLNRVAGHEWWPQEEITPAQEAAVIAAGPADVLLCHDAPADAPLVLVRPVPRDWVPMLPAANAHRMVLQRICEGTRPSWVFHGHYHQFAVNLVTAAWGSCLITALDMDGHPGNWGILDVRTMDFTAGQGRW